MRIVFDLQGVQTPGSRNRGMGRYSMSLLKSMLKHGRGHEFHVVFNGSFLDGIESLYGELREWLPQERFHIFPGVGSTAHSDADNDERRIAAEIAREAFIANLKPDFVHISSLFEGLVDDAVSSIGRFAQTCPVSVTLYDLIPLINRDIYLTNPNVERWYEDRIAHLRRADLLLAISASSAAEATDHLDFEPARVINVGTDADPQFEPSPISRKLARETHDRLGITKPFVMYTGGIDWRKNIEGLMSSYSKIARSLRKKHQLVIVCAVNNEQKAKLEALAVQLGLGPEEILFTGFVSEDDLITLYKSCKLFVFPSWHEGFGLPPLEAMRCGAPVIGGNRSSLPEVIGLPSALFDPLDEDDMRLHLERGLTDEDFRAELVEHGKKQARRFSWDKTGQAALRAIEAHHAETRLDSAVPNRSGARKRLAFVSPIVPAPSGISDYSAELIPALSRHYEIEIVVKDNAAAQQIEDPFIKANMPVRTIDWMKQNFTRYDRVLYQFGNSDHHNHMLHAIPDYPGVVVLHDFFLSGMIAFEQYHYKRGDTWFDHLYHAHGYSAISHQHETSDVHAAIMRYPANRAVIEASLGVIVHSKHSLDLAAKWLSAAEADQWHVIPHLRELTRTIDRKGARERLGFSPDDFIVSSFGFVNPTKQSRRILEAWIASPLARQSKAKLVFVGSNHPGDYGEELLARIAEADCADSVRITGWSDQSLFRDYLSVSDVAVQLRTQSRGETSGTVLDAMNFGLTTIVNSHGSMADLPNDAVIKLPDDFSDEQLTEVLVRVFNDQALRADLAARARSRILNDHSPFRCAEQYAIAIEQFYAQPRPTSSRMIGRIRDLNPQNWSAEALAEVAEAVEVSGEIPRATSYLDVTGALTADRSAFDRDTAELVHGLFLNDLPQRLEPIFFDEEISRWRHARVATLNVVGLTVDSFKDDVVVFASTSDLIHLHPRQAMDSSDQSVGKARVVTRWDLRSGLRETDVLSPPHPLSASFAQLGRNLVPRQE